MKGMMIVVVLVVALGAGAGGAFVMMRGAGGGEKKVVEKVETPPVIIELDEKTVNLADTHYLKAAVALSLIGEKKGEEAIKEFEKAEKPVVMDRLITTMCKQTYKQLLTPEGKKHLKEELIKEIGTDLEGKGWKVHDVLFTDFVME